MIVTFCFVFAHTRPFSHPVLVDFSFAAAWVGRRVEQHVIVSSGFVYAQAQHHRQHQQQDVPAVVPVPGRRPRRPVLSDLRAEHNR